MEQMKRSILFIAITLLSAKLMAQNDSTKTQHADTIRVGGMVIIKKDGPKTILVKTDAHKKQKYSNINTSNFIVDIGFANWSDKTDYAAATAQNYLVNRLGSPALAANDLKLRSSKSSNINLWFFMQRLNLIKHYVNLKYGIGIEMNNYRFKSNISFKEAGVNPYTSQNINHAFIISDSINFSKNKLAADYATIPFMINFRTNPDHSGRGLSISAGVSIGYLYDSKNKQISKERGKLKNHGNYDLEKWKFSYVGELGLGPVRLYGSYSPKSIFENGLNIMPYSVGIRLSNW